VLLLHDSFANIYHRKKLEWGEGAGLGEQLMLGLGAGVQVIAINGVQRRRCGKRSRKSTERFSRKKVVL